MSSEEIEGVLAHEITHVANGDMVTMTLIQGVVNAFVMFLSRVLAFAISQVLRSNSDRDEERGSSWLTYILVPILEIVFMILGSMIVAWFSRWREFRADFGGAKLAGREKMIAALRKLQQVYEQPFEAEPAPASLQALQISSRKGSILRVFASHPPLEERIAALQNQTPY
jgi:heat shock protein HtpX